MHRHSVTLTPYFPKNPVWNTLKGGESPKSDDMLIPPASLVESLFCPRLFFFQKKVVSLQHPIISVRWINSESPRQGGRRSPHLYLYQILRGLAKLIQPFGCDVGTVLPEDGVFKAELDELLLVAISFQPSPNFSVDSHQKHGCLRKQNEKTLVSCRNSSYLCTYKPHFKREMRMDNIQ